MQNHAGPESILALLQAQRHRITFPHISLALDALLDPRPQRDATVMEKALELTFEIALLHKDEVKLAFCRKHVSRLKLLRMRSQATMAFLQIVFDVLCSSLSACDAAEFAELLYAFVDFPVTPPDSFWAELERKGQGMVHEFSLSQCSEILWSIAKLRAGVNCVHLVEELGGLLAELLELHSSDLEPRSASKIIGAYATLVSCCTSLREKVPVRVVEVLLSKLHKLSGWKRDEVATCLWGVAVLNITVDHSDLDFLAGHANDSMRALTIEPLSNLFWAFASLKNQSDWMPHERLLTKMCERGLSLAVEELSHPQVSSLLWSIANLDAHLNGALAKRHKQVMEFILQLVNLLPQLVHGADGHFLVQTMHAMAMMQIWNEGWLEDDTTSVRRSREDCAPDMLRYMESLENAKSAVFSSYKARALEVANELDGAQSCTLLWAIRTLSMDAGGELLVMLSSNDSMVEMCHAVDILWTYAVLWQKPQPAVLVRMQKIAQVGRGLEELSLISVTRFLWALAALFMLGAGDDQWRGVLDKVAALLLQHADAMTAVNFKQLHQFFLTCNTCPALVDVLPESMFNVKDKLENQCCVHVREASAEVHLEHTLGNSCAAQLNKLGLEAQLEVACPNTGYNLDMVVSASSSTPPQLQPPEIEGHRGWVLEIDRSCHYLAGSRSLKDGRCMLREAHLEAVGYSLIRIPHWEWAQSLLRPDHELQKFLNDVLVKGFQGQGLEYL